MSAPRASGHARGRAAFLAHRALAGRGRGGAGHRPRVSWAWPWRWQHDASRSSARWPIRWPRLNAPAVTLVFAPGRVDHHHQHAAHAPGPVHRRGSRRCREFHRRVVRRRGGLGCLGGIRGRGDVEGSECQLRSAHCPLKNVGPADPTRLAPVRRRDARGARLPVAGPGHGGAARSAHARRGAHRAGTVHRGRGRQSRDRTTGGRRRHRARLRLDHPTTASAPPPPR